MIKSQDKREAERVQNRKAELGLADGIIFDDLIIGGTNSTFVSYEGVNVAILPNVSPADITVDSFETF